MESPIEKIEFIKEKMMEVISENNLGYLNANLDDLFNVYSTDLCDILLNYFPGATIMMNKNFRCCAIMIQGTIYNSYGIVNSSDYFVAKKEEIEFIRKSLPQISDVVMNELNEKLLLEGTLKKDSALTLRKNTLNAI